MILPSHITFYLRFKFLLPILLIVIFLSNSPSVNAKQEQFCTDIQRLIEYSKSQFLEIRGKLDENSGGYHPHLVLLDASSCMIASNTEKSSYRCSWDFSHQDKKSRSTFNQFREQINACIGDVANEQGDRLVNHPDYYLSYYHLLPSGQVKVSIKDKAKMLKTFVSISVDGFVNTQ